MRPPQKTANRDVVTRRNAALILMLSAVMFSTAGLLIKIITLSPLALISGRSLIAGLVILLYVRRPRFTWSTAQIGGAMALAGAQIFFVIATRQTSAANAVFIQFTAPIYVAIFAIWFLQEPARPIDWVTMAAVGIGLLLFFSDELALEGVWGNINALISGVCLAWFVLFMRKQKDDSPIETTLLGNLLAALVGLPFLLQASPTWGDVGGVLFLGILQLGIPFILFSIAIKHLSAVESILIQTLEPVLNPIWVFLVIGEQPTARALLGGIIVLVAITMRSLIINRRPRQPAPIR